MNIEQNLFYKANKEFYVDVFFSWFFRQANLKKWKSDIIDFINDLAPVKINKKHNIYVQTDRQYEKVDLWVEVFIKEENRLVVLIFENKLQANESRENQLEYYWKRANEYYKKSASRDNFLTNFGFEATYINPEIYGVYLKLDYDFDNKLSETNEKLFICDVEKVYSFFQKNFSHVSKRESEILYDFTEWIKNKYEEEIKKYLLINLKEINNDYLSERIYQYHLIKKLFRLEDVVESYHENKYEIRKFENNTFIRVGDSFGAPWIQVVFGKKEKSYDLLYRLEKKKIRLLP